jgi:GDP-D-mannose dehydratase
MVDYLLEQTDYVVFGCVRRLSVYNHKNIRHISDERFKLINFDLTDSNIISRIIESLKPKYFIKFCWEQLGFCPANLGNQLYFNLEYP